MDISVLIAAVALLVSLLSHRIASKYALDLLREQEKLRREAEKSRFEQEKRNISRALLCEVRATFQSMASRNYWTPQLDGMFPLWDFSTPRYDQLGDKLGQLDQDLTEALIMLHAEIRVLNGLHRALAVLQDSQTRAQLVDAYRNKLHYLLTAQERNEGVFSPFYSRYNLEWKQHGSDHEIWWN